jgi:hypothetical protein
VVVALVNTNDTIVAVHPEASIGDRIKAAELIFDRVLGRPRESVSLDVHEEVPAWQRLILGSLVGMREGQIVGLVATDEQARQVEQEALEGELLDEEASDDDDASEAGPSETS